MRSGHRRLDRSFNLCYRYIDDLIVFNNKKFIDCVKEISPFELNVEKTNRSDDQANYLDLTFKLYDKYNDYNFQIVNFPFMSSNVPYGPTCRVYIL